MNVQLDTREVQVAITEYLRARGMIIEDVQQVQIGIVKRDSGEQILIANCAPAVFVDNIKLPAEPYR